MFVNRDNRDLKLDERAAMSAGAADGATGPADDEELDDLVRLATLSAEGVCKFSNKIDEKITKLFLKSSNV